jgi:hypothetical protein
MADDDALTHVPDWERKLVEQAVEYRLVEGHLGAVPTELARMRAELFAAMVAARVDDLALPEYA